MPYYVYVLKSLKAGRYYIGQSEDVMERLRRYNRGGVWSTKGYRPWQIHDVEEYGTRKEAIQREHYLKSPVGWRTLQEKKKRVAGFPKGSLRDKSRRSDTIASHTGGDLHSCPITSTS
ncbi:MAG TPA: GIY-YIG nuclease family protein [Bacteroidota bacterium]|nr:GIY-YIG nuclease family protein [Bacteroidota bacterium]